MRGAERAEEGGEMLKLIMPAEQDREAVLSFYREIRRSGGVCIGMQHSEDYDRWLAGMRDRAAGTNLPAGYVRENFYLCYEGDRLVGVFSLKLTLTEYLLNYGGHVGYAIRPSCRNRGLATRMLRQGLSIAGSLGLPRVLCICNCGNYASEKVIRRNGGVLEDERYDPEEQVTVRRFWIRL